MDVSQGIFARLLEFSRVPRVILMNLWKYHIVVQVPQKLGARGAVQPTRATSIEVFVDEECAKYVIDILAYTSDF